MKGEAERERKIGRGGKKENVMRKLKKEQQKMINEKERRKGLGMEAERERKSTTGGHPC